MIAGGLFGGIVLWRALWSTGIGPLADTPVELYSGVGPTGSPMAVVTTDAQGGYQFEVDATAVAGYLWMRSTGQFDSRMNHLSNAYRSRRNLE